ncbi:hypothetical protein NBH19_08770 [Rhizobium sp. S95]|uniref:Uncharacterized protein n=1 Tax=Ciceribacter sichuanensis TaxID=2949647 RepID=A0AAJ1F5E0_9HYPH|nr:MULTISPECIES: hypothetical protein [unclassified Ciceribacter]MCM2396169.1 hypothetical protein [Ciceribacter sp. S95]MCO5957680.1 hypothetical protein [Ciceribacter sp. S101]
MTAMTKGVLCAANQWTPLATGKAKVLALIRTPSGSGYIKTGADTPLGAPDPDAAEGDATFDFFPIAWRQPVSLAFDDASTNLYFYPDGDAPVAVSVIME